MRNQNGRLGTSQQCPEGSQPYQIKAGDTFYKLAQRFNTTVDTIQRLNPQVNPLNLQIGQQLCLPLAEPTPTPEIRVPCCSLLIPSEGAPQTARGAVLVGEAEETGLYYLTFSAIGLPEPSSLGDFNTFVGLISISLQTPAEPPVRFAAILDDAQALDQPKTWCGSRLLDLAPRVPSRMEIRPYNTETGSDGAPLLLGNLDRCRA